MALPWSSSLDICVCARLQHPCLRASGLVTVESARSERTRRRRSVSAAEPDPTLGPSDSRSKRRQDRPAPWALASSTHRGAGSGGDDSIRPHTTGGSRLAGRPAWTWSLRAIGNTSSPLHFIHNADGTGRSESTGARQGVEQRKRVRTSSRPTRLGAPKVGGTSSGAKALGAVVNDCSCRGVHGRIRRPTTPGTVSGERWEREPDGSPNYLARIVLNGDPGGLLDNQQQFNRQRSGPTYRSIGTSLART